MPRRLGAQPQKVNRILRPTFLEVHKHTAHKMQQQGHNKQFYQAILKKHLGGSSMQVDIGITEITTDELRGIIAAFAEKNGYDLIVDASAAVYSQKALDVTPAVLKELVAEKGKASQDKETVKNESK